MSVRGTGLEWRRTADAVREFVRDCAGERLRRAVLCTYDFDPQRFDDVVFRELRRKFRILVIADAGALQAPLEKTKYGFGRYELAPARCLRGGVFHAKVVFLRAGAKYLIGIGSANLTAGGLGGNLELMLFADHTTAQGRTLAAGLAHFFGRLLKSKDVRVSKTAKKFLDLTTAGIKPQRGIVLDTLETPMLSQMTDSCKKRSGLGIRSLTVLSPWHGKAVTPDQVEPQVVRELRKHLNIRGDVQVYTRDEDGKRRGPDLGKNVAVFVSKSQFDGPSLVENHRADDGEDAIRAYHHRPTDLHAKAYLVEAPTGGLLFVGSANCTAAALLRPAARGGNVELLVPLHLTPHQVTQFKNDLGVMFVSAQTLGQLPSRKYEGKVRGQVLSGRIVGRTGRTLLEIEAPDACGNTVSISGDEHVFETNMKIDRGGIGRMDDTQELAKLFPGSSGVPSRADDSWTSVLWEKVNGFWVPFPVVVPLAANSSADPCDSLLDVLDDLFGRWPVNRASQAAGLGNEPLDDAPPNDDNDDDALLTAAAHQGKLDRIAVALARIRKRIRAHGLTGTEASSVVERIKEMGWEPHLAPVIRSFLRKGK